MQRHFNWFCFITHILYQWIAIFLVSDLPALFLAKPCSEGVFVIFIACGDRRSPITGNQPISAVSIVARWPRNGEAQASWGHQRAWPAAERNKWQEPQIVEPQQDMHSMRGRIASYCVKPWDGQKGIHPCLVGIIGGHGSCNCSLSSVENQSYHLLQGGSRTDKHRRHRLPGVTSVRDQPLKETNRRSPRLWSHSKTSKALYNISHRMIDSCLDLYRIECQNTCQIKMLYRMPAVVSDRISGHLSKQCQNVWHMKRHHIWQIDCRTIGQKAFKVKHCWRR